MRFLREMLRPFSFRWPVGGTLQMTKARNAGEARRLADIPNIGPAMVEDFRNLGIEQPGQLTGKDPYALYEHLCAEIGRAHVCTPVPHAHLVCRLLIENTKKTHTYNTNKRTRLTKR